MIQPRISSDESTRARNPFCIGVTIVVMSTSMAIVLSGCVPPEHGGISGNYSSTIEQLAVRREKFDSLVARRARGRQVYEHYCQICHGLEAQGNGFNAAMLDPPPRNFADEAFWEKTDDEHLLKIIGQGGQAAGKSKLMPPWGHTLNDQQIDDVIAFLRTVPDLAKEAEEAEAEEAGASE